MWEENSFSYSGARWLELLLQTLPKGLVMEGDGMSSEVSTTHKPVMEV